MFVRAMKLSAKYRVMCATAILSGLPIVIIALMLRILCADQNASSGFMTLKVNISRLCRMVNITRLKISITPLFRDQLTPEAVRSAPRDILQDLRDEASNAVNSAASRVNEVANHVESAVSSAIASSPNLDDFVPSNCSFGMEQFCLNFNSTKQDTICIRSSFEPLKLLPESVRGLPEPLQLAIEKYLEAFNPVTDKLRSLPAQAKAWLISGTISVTLLLILGLVILYVFHLKPLSLVATWCRNRASVTLVVCFTLGVISCLPYVLLVHVQHKVYSVAASISDWVDVEKGQILGLSIGILSCGLSFSVLLAATIPIVSKKNP
jgi:hypothetical protein